jgi:hypothetical protein
MHILTLCISNPLLSQNHPNLNNSIFWRISHNIKNIIKTVLLICHQQQQRIRSNNENEELFFCPLNFKGDIWKFLTKFFKFIDDKFWISLSLKNIKMRVRW